MALEFHHNLVDPFTPPRENELVLKADEVQHPARRTALMVLSGGIDSVTMLHEYRATIAMAVNFHYGSNHNDRERQCAHWQCELLGIPLVEIPLEFMEKYFESSLLKGAEAIPDAEYEESNMQSTVVPFRNGIMLAIATGLAESYGLDTVMMANHAGDHAIYPDCREVFVQAMKAAMATGTYNNVQLFCPYTNLTKAEIVKRAVALDVDLHHTYSCYRGAQHHCGTCATCRERDAALLAAGLSPADYR